MDQYLNSHTGGGEVRHDWRREEVAALHGRPLLELVYQAAAVHRRHHDPSQVQVCRLVSIKTGGCPEDCGYCSQSMHHAGGAGGVEPEPMLGLEQVMSIARQAKQNGITRLCMGAAWREVRNGRPFESVLQMVREVTDLGLEVCCTLGMLTDEQARRLAEAGLHAYNHNLDTSEEFYHTIITTRTYADRMRTLGAVREAGVTVCCGGIIGMGERAEDRLALLLTLAGMRPHPESVPINVLAKVPGTPLENAPDLPVWETVRMIAMARIMMPASTVRLSTGRAGMSAAEQALCFMAGANSIFSSDERKMLTSKAPSPDYEADRRLLAELGLTMRPPFHGGKGPG